MKQKMETLLRRGVSVTVNSWGMGVGLEKETECGRKNHSKMDARWSLVVLGIEKGGHTGTEDAY